LVLFFKKELLAFLAVAFSVLVMRGRRAGVDA
jgi:hypothetical protein